MIMRIMIRMIIKIIMMTIAWNMSVTPVPEAAEVAK